MEQHSLCVDPDGVLRGACEQCQDCPLWRFQAGSPLDFKTMGMPDSACTAACEACGCPASKHASHQDWLQAGRTIARKIAIYDDSGEWPQETPFQSKLPAVALEWEPIGAALHTLTDGQFDPSVHRRNTPTYQQLDQTVETCTDLVSVVCVSLEKNHDMHPLLYECFAKQTWRNIELVVVDSGTQPSFFLQEKAKEDSRVLYRFFHRDEHAVEQDEDPLDHVLKPDCAEEVLYFVEGNSDEHIDISEVPWRGWSRGLKRNIANYLARGTFLVHFNVGDMYAPGYVSAMVAVFVPEKTAAVGLAQWHGIDMSTEAFRLLVAETSGYIIPEARRELAVCQHGFTYAYTRSAWLLAPFLDTEEPDGYLMHGFEDAKVSVQLLDLPLRGNDALAAHIFDKEGSSGAHAAASINLSNEIADFQARSVGVSVPAAFQELLPCMRSVVSKVSEKRNRGLNDFLHAQGSVFFCHSCAAAIALRKKFHERKVLADGAGGKVEVLKFLSAGGAVAEGEATYEEWPKGVTPQRVQPFDFARPRKPPQKQQLFNSHGRLQLPPSPGIASNVVVPHASQTLAGGLRSGIFNAQVTRPPPFRGPTGFNPTGFGGLNAFGRGPTQNQLPQFLRSSAMELPDDVWFPGWSSRNAICRRCGCHIGWRYERNQSLFWVLENHLVKERSAPREASSQSSAVARSMPAEVSPKPNNLCPGLSNESEQLGVSTLPREVLQALGADRVDAKGTGKQEDRSNTNDAQKKEKAYLAARDALQLLSSQLQKHLAHGIMTMDKSRFDQCLNELEIDDVTHQNLRVELLIKPYIDANQAAKLVNKGFKAKVNSLRSLGLKPLRRALESLLPDEMQKAVEAEPQSETGAFNEATQCVLEKVQRDGSKTPNRSPRSGSRRGRAV